MFEEIYDGPKDPSWTWVTTNEPDASILGLLKKLSAEEASRLLPSGQSVASHTEHLRWSLALGNSYLRGEKPQPDWEESWKVTVVDAAQWDRLRADLKAESDTLRAAVVAHQDWSDPIFFTGTFAMVPHAAYHLGAMRQMAAAAKSV
ncbi:hypothetical protein EON80_16665 [bacterium]|nr:MAG: hypothetical protein EON80_16665 [bacterium]